MRIVLPPPSKITLHEGVSWAELEEILREFEEAWPGYRIAYDRGRLEIVSPTQEHEQNARLAHDLVVVLCDEENVDFVCLGQWTLRREDLLRAIEADDCFYIAHAPEVRGKKIDLRRDPPPDLAIESEVSRTSLDRLPIYSSLGVPELWRIRDDHVRGYRLAEDGEYHTIESSLAFSWLRVEELSRFIARRKETGGLSIIRAFRAWVREQRGGDD